jgi:hypothetical protein
VHCAASGTFGQAGCDLGDAANLEARVAFQPAQGTELVDKVDEFAQVRVYFVGQATSARVRVEWRPVAADHETKRSAAASGDLSLGQSRGNGVQGVLFSQKHV